MSRIQPDFQLIRELHNQGYRRIIGLDEVGRGALAGPIVVAAVELPVLIANITDSKLLTKQARENIAREIHRQASTIRIGSASAKEIDRLGIVEAQRLAYNRTLQTLSADLFLTDFYPLPNRPYLTAPKGDRLFYPVAAASIVAKVYRDQLMNIYHYHFPAYGWKTNVGYGTKFHLAAVKTAGATPLHRASFLRC